MVYFQLLHNYNDITAASDADKSSVFNQFFHSAFTSSSFVFSDFATILLLMFCLILIYLHISDVFHILVNLDPQKLWVSTEFCLVCSNTVLRHYVFYFIIRFHLAFVTSIFHLFGKFTRSLLCLNQVTSTMLLITDQFLFYALSLKC